MNFFKAVVTGVDDALGLGAGHAERFGEFGVLGGDGNAIFSGTVEEGVQPEALDRGTGRFAARRRGG